MNFYLFFDVVTGEITKRIVCQSQDASLNAGPNESWVQIPEDSGAADDTHYVDVETGEVKAKELLTNAQELTLAAGERTTILLPEVCEVTVEGDASSRFTVEDGVLELEFSLPGIYAISFSMLHYRKEEVIANVQAT